MFVSLQHENKVVLRRALVCGMFMVAHMVSRALVDKHISLALCDLKISKQKHLSKYSRHGHHFEDYSRDHSRVEAMGCQGYACSRVTRGLMSCTPGCAT